MSRAERQTIIMISIVSGSLATIEDFKLETENMPSIVYCKEVADELLKSYPCNDSNDKLLKYVKSKISSYDIALREFEQDRYYSLLLLTMCSHILTDLQSRIRDERKLGMLEPLAEAIEIVHDRLDPDKEKFDVYESANRLVSMAYKIIGF